MLNKYALFMGDTYYPGGGWDDWCGSFATTGEAFTKMQNTHCDWWQVVNVETGLVIASGKRDNYECSE